MVLLKNNARIEIVTKEMNRIQEEGAKQEGKSTLVHSEHIIRVIYSMLWPS